MWGLGVVQGSWEPLGDDLATFQRARASCPEGQEQSLGKQPDSTWCHLLVLWTCVCCGSGFTWAVEGRGLQQVGALQSRSHGEG